MADEIRILLVDDKESHRRFIGDALIFITAYPEDEAMRNLRAAGVPMLAKPLRDYHDILDAVRHVLGRT